MRVSCLQSSKSHFLELNSIVLWPSLTSWFRGLLTPISKYELELTSLSPLVPLLLILPLVYLAQPYPCTLGFHASSPKFTSELWISFTHYAAFHAEELSLENKQMPTMLPSVLTRVISITHAQAKWTIRLSGELYSNGLPTNASRDSR